MTTTNPNQGIQMQNQSTPTFQLEERLTRWNDTLDNMRQEYGSKSFITPEDRGKADRVLGMWEGKVSKLQSEVQGRRDAEVADPMGVKGDASPASGESNGDKPSGRKAKTGGTPKCLCGCDASNGPGSRFRPGHDARVKGMINRVSNDLAESGFSFPRILIEEATRNSSLSVASYDAAFILKMDKKLGSGQGHKPPKAENAGNGDAEKGDKGNKGDTKAEADKGAAA